MDSDVYKNYIRRKEWRIKRKNAFALQRKIMDNNQKERRTSQNKIDSFIRKFYPDQVPNSVLRQRQKSKQYYELHKDCSEFKERHRRRSREYYNKHKDCPEFKQKCREASKRWRDRNKDNPEFKAKQRQYYLTQKRRIENEKNNIKRIKTNDE